MTTKKSPEEIRDFALYGFKAFQDIIFVAFERSDLETLKKALDELFRLFESFLARPGGESLYALKYHIERAAGPERNQLQTQYDRQKRRKDVANSLVLAREQVTFGIAARALELTLSSEDQTKIQMYHELEAHLPTTLTRLTKVFETINDGKTPDFWGWHWFDIVPDGRAHFVDNFSRPNRLYCVRGLQLLENVADATLETASLPVSDDLVYLFDDNNAQGIPAMLRQIRDQNAHYARVLTPAQIGKIDSFLTLLAKAKGEQERIRRERLAAAPINDDKRNEFIQNVVDAFKGSCRLLPIMNRLGIYRDMMESEPPKDVRSWGYNQIDDKGAFVADWHVSYPGWGEAYGRGLGQAADQFTFSDMVEAARKVATTGQENLLVAIDAQIRKANLRDPVIFQSLTSTFEYGEFRQREWFYPSYKADCPKTALSDCDGFIGVLKVAGLNVPVINVFTQDKKQRNKIVIAQPTKFLHWEQFTPIDIPEDKVHVRDGIFVNVVDLNIDVERRARILKEAPDWLTKHGDSNAQLEYLRTHVVVNVYLKFRVSIKDVSAAICITVRADRSHV
jgi:hypothetical protein